MIDSILKKGDISDAQYGKIWFELVYVLSNDWIPGM